MRQVYVDADSNVEITKISFYSPNEGYASFEKFLGFTQDSGRTFQKKYITNSNVNFNGYMVNLTFGFALQGVYAFNQDTLIAYGHYGFVPAILYSTNQGNSYTLVFHSTLVQGQFNYGVLDMKFPGNGSIGFAVDGDRILRTTNKGISWSSVRNEAGAEINHLSFVDNTTGFAFSESKLIAIKNSGSLTQQISFSASSIGGAYFLNADTGWVNASGGVYYTTDAGTTWTLQNTGCHQVFSPGFAFINDSTGYALAGYDIVKTTDRGKVWERLERDNNYSYLNYSHNDLFFYSPTQFWAGGGHGFLELTNNGGGNTLPKACFVADVSQLWNNNVILVNQSKQGYAYKWFKNGVLLATIYNVTYTTPRLQLDTIMLVVTKGLLSDTAVQIVDTRNTTAWCDGWYTFSTDTAVAHFQSSFDAFGAVHIWDYGDGVIDSGVANPNHVYATVGYYNVKHTVRYDAVSCIDSKTQTVQIARTYNCSQGYIAYEVADTFFTNRYKFTFVPDLTTDMGGYNIGASWDFGDGNAAGGNPVVHAYDTTKFYNVRATILNGWTHCLRDITAAVPIQVDSGCHGDFQVKAQLTVPVKFYTHPTTDSLNKRHTWIFYNHDTVSSGAAGYLERSFFFPTNDGSIIESIQSNTGSGSPCSYPQLNNYYINALDVPVKHIVTDTITGCTDSSTTTFRIPTIKDVSITATPDPLFPFWVKFQAWDNRFGSGWPYCSIWRTYNPSQYGGGTLYGGSYGCPSSYWNLLVSGYASVAVTSPTCLGNNVMGNREAYIMDYSGPILGDCDAYPPDFNFNATGQSNQYTFSIAYPVDYVNAITMGWQRKWYFGASDSSTLSSPVYTFPAGIDSSTVTLKYISPAGCEKSVSKMVYRVLPVKLMSFTAERKGSTHLLLWKTASEHTNAGFEVQISTDGINFSPLQFVESKAVNGNSTRQIMYDYTNARPPAATTYYRLRQIDKDGNGVLSNVVRLETSSGNHAFNVYPNPATGIVNIVSNQMQSIIITDATGRALIKYHAGESSKVRLDIHALPPGVYIVKVVGADSATWSEKLIINKP